MILCQQKQGMANVTSFEERVTQRDEMTQGQPLTQWLTAWEITPKAFTDMWHFGIIHIPFFQFTWDLHFHIELSTQTGGSTRVCCYRAAFLCFVCITHKDQRGAQRHLYNQSTITILTPLCNWKKKKKRKKSMLHVNQSLTCLCVNNTNVTSHWELLSLNQTFRVD